MPLEDNRCGSGVAYAMGPKTRRLNWNPDEAK